MIQIEIEENIVNLYLDDKDSPIYRIRIEELPLMVVDNGHNLSEWIMQLMTKTWIEIETLYQLASLIQKNHPKNKIDWKETFFPIEKKHYLDHVKAIKKITSEKMKPQSYFEILKESIETGIEEQNKSVNTEISKIVSQRLEEYGLN